MLEKLSLRLALMGTKNIVKKVGKGVSGAVKATTHAFSNIGKAIGFG